jgi:hypothetical protein
MFAMLSRERLEFILLIQSLIPNPYLSIRPSASRTMRSAWAAMA